MKGIILAGGTGSRLSPLTKVINKHLFPIGKFPMIYYPIAKMRECGINNVLIITGKNSADSLISLLGSGAEFQMEFSYRVQEESGGIAHALSLAEPFVGSEHSLVILGDNIFTDNLRECVTAFEKQPFGAKILIKSVSDPERYGVAEIKDGQIKSLEEKPKSPKTNYCVTGIYLYDNQVFENIRKLQPSTRGELEITDVNKEYLQSSALTFDILNGWWIDAGTWEAIHEANQYLWSKAGLAFGATVCHNLAIQ